MDDASNLNFPMRKKREPKIIVFEEPTANRQSKNNVANGKRKRFVEKDEMEYMQTDFINIAREVKEFGVTGFTRKEQKKNRQKYAEYLGARKQKPQKVPYPMLQERIKHRKMKELKEREMERAMGIFKKKKKEDNVKLTQKLNLGRWVDKSVMVKHSRTTSIKISSSELAKIRKLKK